MTLWEDYKVALDDGSASKDRLLIRGVISGAIAYVS